MRTLNKTIIETCDFLRSWSHCCSTKRQNITDQQIYNIMEILQYIPETSFVLSSASVSARPHPHEPVVVVLYCTHKKLRPRHCQHTCHPLVCHHSPHSVLTAGSGVLYVENGVKRCFQVRRWKVNLSNALLHDE
jgi:hypothetical protein